MHESEKRISDGTSAILVKDESLAKMRWEAPFYKWLEAEGFVNWGQKGFYSGVDWIFVNLNSKLMAPGMPGIAVTQPLGQHAITVEEFKIIYEIFKKYEGISGGEY